MPNNSALRKMSFKDVLNKALYLEALSQIQTLILMDLRLRHEEFTFFILSAVEWRKINLKSTKGQKKPDSSMNPGIRLSQGSKEIKGSNLCITKYWDPDIYS